MFKVTPAEFQSNIGAYTDIAMQEPLFVTSHQRDRFVVISSDENERQRERGEPLSDDFKVQVAASIERHKETPVELSQR